MKPFVFLLLLTCPVICRGQVITETTPPNLTPKVSSPEVSAFTRYGDIPVGLYTGVPNISIPLYTIKAKGINIPIGLNYHSSGIRVNDMATNVGLGWSLDAGGAITSSVNGLPDMDGWLNSEHTPQTGNLPLTFNSNGFLSDSQYKFMMGSALDTLDTKPDMFYLNMPGKNLKFFFDQDRNIYTVPYQRVKIVPGSGHDFSVTDEQDNYFEFDKEEYALTDPGATGGTIIHSIYPVTSYYLTRIITALHDTVTFSYDSLQYSFNNQAAETRYGKINGYYSCDPPSSRIQTSTTTIRSAQRIATITSTSGERVVFTYGLNRTDLDGTRALTQVSVYYKNNATPIKTFDLNYDYFSGPRLKLTGVKESGVNPYSFEYDNTALPARFSYAQDAWGYFNGRTNTTLLPADDTHGFFFGADREVNPVVVQAGILKKINYPTGGYSQFAYEPNDYVSTELTGSTKGSAQLIGLANQTMNQPFTVTTGSAYFTLFYNSGNPGSSSTSPLPPVGIPPTGDNEAQIILTGPNNYQSIYHGQSVSQGLLIPNLVPGNYNIQIISNGDFNSPYLQILWMHPADPSTMATITKASGGLRVKSITNYSGISSNILSTKYFEYKDLSGQSSGIVGYKPQYMNYQVHKDVDMGSYLQECYYTSQSSNSLSPLTVFQGGNVVYTRVKVYTQDPTGMGYTDNVLSHYGGTTGVVGYPYAPVIANDWIDGLPIETTDYAYNNTVGKYTPLKKVTNTYKYAFGLDPATNPNEHSVRGLAIGLYIPGVPVAFPPRLQPRDPQFMVSEYHLYSSWFYPTSKTETSYDLLDTNKKVITVSKYYYDNPNHIELTREEVSKSTGEHYNVLMRYPKDYNPAYPYNSSPVVEKRVMINDGTSDRLTKAEITTYKTEAGAFPNAFYSLKNMAPVTPSSVPLYNGATVNSNYEKRASYYYDSGNNVVTIRRDSLVVSGYQWGYNKQYVIAEAKNAKSNSIFYESFEEGAGNSTLEDDKTGHYSHTGPYSKPLSGLDAGSYTLSYWQKTGGVWSFITAPVTVTGTTYSISLNAQIDDVRFYPLTAQMTTYTYDPLIGMTSSTDAKGLVSYYEYDSFQRLLNVKDQDGNILKSYDYHYRPQ